MLVTHIVLPLSAVHGQLKYFFLCSHVSVWGLVNNKELEAYQSDQNEDEEETEEEEPPIPPKPVPPDSMFIFKASNP